MQGFKSKNSLTERFTNTKLPQNDKNLMFNQVTFPWGLMSENISQLNNQRFFGQGGSRKFKSLCFCDFSLVCFGLFYPSQVCESPPFSQTVDKPVDAKHPQHDAKNLAGDLAGEQGGRPPPSKQTA